MAKEFTDTFWRWFGNSKVVDSKGNPLVVYHGTRSYFSRFKKQNKMNYFCLNRDYAWCMAKERGSGYGDSINIIAVYLSSENPIDLRALGSRIEFTADEIRSELKRLGVKRNFLIKDNGDFSLAWWQWIHYKSIQDAIIDSGYDGIVMREESSGCTKFNDDNDIFVVFDPNQIKAIDNDGSYDLDDDNIRSNPKRRRNDETKTQRRR